MLSTSNKSVPEMAIDVSNNHGAIPGSSHSPVAPAASRPSCHLQRSHASAGRCESGGR